MNKACACAQSWCEQAHTLDPIKFRELSRLCGRSASGPTLFHTFEPIHSADIAPWLYDGQDWRRIEGGRCLWSQRHMPVIVSRLPISDHAFQHHLYAKAQV